MKKSEMKKSLPDLYPGIYPADSVEVDWPTEAEVQSRDFAPTRADNVEVVIKIKGLRPVPGDVDMFELQDVAMRRVDWDAVRTAMGLPLGHKGDKLMEKLGAVLWKHDVMEVLKDRIL